MIGGILTLTELPNDYVLFRRYDFGFMVYVVFARDCLTTRDYC